MELYARDTSAIAKKHHYLISVFLLSLFVISIPFYGFSFLNIDGRGVLRPDWIFGAAIILAIFLNILAQRRKIRIDPVSRIVLMYNIVVILSFVACWYRGNCNILDFLTSWVQLIFISFLYMSISNMSLSMPHIRVILKVWLGISFLVALYAVYQVLARNFGWELAFLHLTNPSVAVAGMRSGVFGGYVRPSSVLTEPTYLGAYLLSPTTLLAMIYLYHKDRRFFFSSRSVNRVILITLVAALILSFALASYLTVAIFCFFSLFYKPVRKKLIQVVPSAVVLLVGLAVILSLIGVNFVGVTERISGIGKGLSSAGLAGVGGKSVGVRLAGAVAAVGLWTEHPLLGVGLNQFGASLPGYAPSWFKYPADQLTLINSVWPQVLVETGLLGLTMVVLLWVVALRTVRRAIKVEIGDNKVLLIAVFCVLLIDVIGVSFNLPFTHPQRWFDLGLASVILRSLVSRTGLHETTKKS